VTRSLGKPVTSGGGRSINGASMVNANPKSDLYDAIERAALAAYGELLSPELAHAAASAFAREKAEMVEDLLHDGAEALREQIQGQLAALTAGPKAKGPAKKKPGRPAAAGEGAAAAPKKKKEPAVAPAAAAAEA
jgi:hypothetical protein